MKNQHFNLSVKYDQPAEVWKNVVGAYAKLDGWLGFGDGLTGEKGIPYWFSFDENEKHICASVEPSGLSFSGRVSDADWALWKYKTKVLMSHSIGLIVGEIEEGEVGYEAESLE